MTCNDKYQNFEEPMVGYASTATRLITASEPITYSSCNCYNSWQACCGCKCHGCRCGTWQGAPYNPQLAELTEEVARLRKAIRKLEK